MNSETVKNHGYKHIWYGNASKSQSDVDELVRAIIEERDPPRRALECNSKEFYMNPGSEVVTNNDHDQKQHLWVELRGIGPTSPTLVQFTRAFYAVMDLTEDTYIKTPQEKLSRTFAEYFINKDFYLPDRGRMFFDVLDKVTQYIWLKDACITSIVKINPTHFDHRNPYMDDPFLPSERREIDLLVSTTFVITIDRE